MSYSINLGSWQSIFAVPSDVVDKHLKLAGGAQLKVLLWVLRHAGSSFEAETLGEALNMHPADVKDAMQYWVETGLLTVSGDTFSPAPSELASASGQDTMPAAQAAPSAAKLREIQAGPSLSHKGSQPADDMQQAADLPKPSRPLSRPQKPDSLFVAKRAQEDSDIAFLMQEAQVILGKTISNGDSATLLMLHDTDGLPVDVILMLLQYASSIGKGNMRYIEKAGIHWADEGIDSLELAEQKIRQLDQSQKAWATIQRLLGLERRSPTAKETQFADRWINEWCFSEDLIREAYERNVDAKGKFSFPYMNRILERWKKEGIETLEQAQNERKPFQESSGSGEEQAPSYDLEAYERSSIFDD